MIEAEINTIEEKYISWINSTIKDQLEALCALMFVHEIGNSQLQIDLVDMAEQCFLTLNEIHPSGRKDIKKPNLFEEGFEERSVDWRNFRKDMEDKRVKKVMVRILKKLVKLDVLKITSSCGWRYHTVNVIWSAENV